MLRSMLAITVLGAVATWGAADGVPLREVQTVRPAPQQVSFRGQIVLVQKDELVVSVAGQHIRFRVASDVRITLNGRPAQLGDLKPRQAVSIWADIKSPEPVAKHIRATSRMQTP